MTEIRENPNELPHLIPPLKGVARRAGGCCARKWTSVGFVFNGGIAWELLRAFVVGILSISPKLSLAGTRVTLR